MLKELERTCLLIPEMPMFLKYNIKGSTFLETPVPYDEHEKVHVSASIPDTIEAYGRLFASATRFSTTANVSGKRDVKSPRAIFASSSCITIILFQSNAGIKIPAGQVLFFELAQNNCLQ